MRFKQTKEAKKTEAINYSVTTFTSQQLREQLSFNYFQFYSFFFFTFGLQFVGFFSFFNGFNRNKMDILNGINSQTKHLKRKQNKNRQKLNIIGDKKKHSFTKFGHYTNSQK